MKFVIVFEAGGNASAALAFRARTIAPDADILALCEEGAAFPSSACGANEAVEIPFCEDDSVQAQRIADALVQLKPDAVLFPATVRGRFLSAWAAAKLDTGLTADCTDLGLTPSGLLRQIRPAFGGNLTAEILCRSHRPQMASVRPGVFAPPPAQEGVAGLPVRRLTVSAPRSKMRRTDFLPIEDAAPLQNAQIIVAGGKGVGGAAGFAKLARLAKLMGASLGASRSAVDAGWIGYEHQVGQTGVVVRPRLYIAFGISGCIQHTVGMNASQVVVAVNRDRNAPIFSCADYGIVADWETTADEMIADFIERKGEP